MNTEFQGRTAPTAPQGLRGWYAAFLLALAVGFFLLFTIIGKAYTEAPPIPDRVIEPNGQVLFTGSDIREGQELFLRYDLMDNGTVWGHGAYLGPDFPALTLHRMGLEEADYLANRTFNKNYDSLDRFEKLRVDPFIIPILKENRYNSTTKVLEFSPSQVVAFHREAALWKQYFADPAGNGGLKAHLITDAAELKKLSAYFTWMAWASVAKRPGTQASYTNNFPYDPFVGNTPTTETVIASVASLLFLLGGIGLVLFLVARQKDWDWHPEDAPLAVYTEPGVLSDTQKGVLKFVVVAAFLLLIQTLVGGGVAHYRADPGSFYGWDLSVLFPSSLLRTFHLQTMIFWVATGFVAGGLFLSDLLGGRQSLPAQKLLMNTLFAAFATVIFGSLLGEWGGSLGLWNNLTFWLGSQGWEYLEIGRFWQILLLIGLFFWVLLVYRNTRSALNTPGSRGLATLFLIAAFAIPFFYIPAFFFDGQTNYTIVDTWRFWIIHLWVEGFFELFATTMVAVVFVELGLVAKKNAVRLILLEGILIFMGGIVGVGHHWYFSGMTSYNLLLSSSFSALEVVPLVLLCADAAGFIRTMENPLEASAVHAFRWPLRFFMAVGFWNFVGAGVLGFLINMPIVSYFEIGTYLTPNHGHAAMFGVFGMLSVGLCLFILRDSCSQKDWEPLEKYVRLAFYGFNAGLALMLLLSLMPAGFLQLWDVVANGYWHARSTEFTATAWMTKIGWLRIIGDLVFIFGGAVPFLIVSVKVWLRVRRLYCKAL